MTTKYALGSDEGLIPTVDLESLSSYLVDGQEYVDLCLTEAGYERLKQHFFRLFESEQEGQA
ncbi:hypothetical protein [Pseudomonas aeruginosa]|uniref:hypothetical protein n=1 Tax=Pseudomonas aeruginosa TaxID=287 RepID=UPI00287F4F3E|nr:hypothetical protein [Pseudomonas aeruginosa]